MRHRVPPFSIDYPPSALATLEIQSFRPSRVWLPSEALLPRLNHLAEEQLRKVQDLHINYKHFWMRGFKSTLAKAHEIWSSRLGAAGRLTFIHGHLR